LPVGLRGIARGPTRNEWIAFVLAGVSLLLSSRAVGQQADPLFRRSQQAKNLLAQGRFAEAISIYEELLKAMPGNPGLRLNLGIAQHMAGRDREAAVTLGEVLRIQPNHGAALAMCGATYLRLGDPAKAFGFLERAARVLPQDQEILRMLADAALMSGKFAVAAASLRSLAKMHPEESRIWADLGRSYEALSEEAFTRLDSLEPGSPYWLALAAETRVKQRQFRSALGLYREALAKMNRRDWRENVAVIYQETGHPDWAAAEKAKADQLSPPRCATPSAECQFLAKRYLQAAEMSGRTAEFLYWRAKAYNELAREAFLALSRLPDSAEWHAFLGSLYRNQNRHEESIKEWQAAIEKRPGDLDLQRELAATILANKEYAKAEAALRLLVEKAPDNTELLVMLGDALIAQQKLEDAIAPLEKATRLAPTMLTAQASLGRALLSANRAAEAVPHLHAALPADRDGSVHFQLSRALAAQGETVEAAQLAQKSLQLRKLVEEPEQGGDITPPQP
jgi:predicted Zn-dependent protease